MARGEHQKLKLLFLQQLLLEQSDEEHPISTQAIIHALEARGIASERKSIYRDMEVLSEFGLDVHGRKGRSAGWFVGERRFQLPELKLLVDAVQSCKFITKRKSRELIRKLESLSSVHQARQLHRQVYVTGRPKTVNETVYYSIDQLHAAISGGRAVTFQYFEYDLNKKPVFRHGGARYTVSPYGLIWDNENYYLAGYDHDREALRHYRVDKMVDLTVTALPRREEGQYANLDMGEYVQKHFGMFSGREGQVRLRCARRLVGVILDRFGLDVLLIPDGEDHFTVTVSAVVSPQFLGWLFGLGPDVELLSPEWALEAYRAQLSGVARSCGLSVVPSSL